MFDIININMILSSYKFNDNLILGVVYLMKQSIRQNKMLLAVTLLFSIITSAAGVLVAIILQKVIDAAMQGDMLLFKKF